jgi:hypothetical protein
MFDTLWIDGVKPASASSGVRRNNVPAMLSAASGAVTP